MTSQQLWTPAIPNLLHWFRRYVVVDLARISATIDELDIPNTHHAFFRFILASIIRKSSNADPVPVSGLEVTAHMKKLEAAGRVINPFDIFRKAVERALSAAEAYCAATTPFERVSVYQADATSLKSKIRNRVDAVITSPPYHNAVDYYRRHQLEMYWLGLTPTRQDRLKLLPKYIGRPSVSRADPLLGRVAELGPLSSEWNERIREVSIRRADAFVHYIISMKDTLDGLADIVKVGGPMVLVLGHSKWNGLSLPTSELFLELAGDSFQLEDRLWYPVKNRYMSYSRHNGADINREYVLVFRRTQAAKRMPGAKH